MIVNIVSLIILVSEIIFMITLFIKTRNNRLVVSKQNAIWFFPVFVFLFLLYLTGYFVNEPSYSIIGIINNIIYSLKTFAFEINPKYINTLFESSILFTIAFVVGYLMAVFTTISTALGFIIDYLINRFKCRKIKAKGCDIVLGYNEASFIYINKHKNNTILWLNDVPNSEQIKFLYNNKIAFIKAELNSKHLQRFVKKRTRYNFIAFDYEEENYQNIIDTFIATQNEENYIFLYLEVKFNESEVIREEYLKNKQVYSNLFIRMFSRYELISRRFISKVTIPSLLQQRFFNENRTIKSDHKINVFLYGFGKVNASLFTMFCQNNQLVGMKGDVLKSHLINYYVIDRNQNVINSRRTQYLINNINKFHSDLELPEKLCEFNILPFDVNSDEVTKQVKEIAEDEKSFNLFIVSYGNDFENAETALWLNNEFGSFNGVVACRLKKIRIQSDKIIYFGNEDEIIAHQYIVDEEIIKFAKDIDSKYNKLKHLSYLDFERHWERLNQIELYSNIYNAISIKFKLNLMGLDLSKDFHQESLTVEEIMEIYTRNSNQAPSYEDYFKTNIRNVIAYSEKLRWNAFYLFNGYKPMKLDDIKLQENKIIWKDNQKRLHACLTSMRGLDQLHQYVAKEFKLNLDDVETYKYDYMVFDNKEDNLIVSLLEKGYKIFPINK